MPIANHHSSVPVTVEAGTQATAYVVGNVDSFTVARLSGSFCPQFVA